MAITRFETALPKHYWVMSTQKRTWERDNAKVSVLREQTPDAYSNPVVAFILSSKQGYEAFVRLGMDSPSPRDWCLGAFENTELAEAQIVEFLSHQIASQVLRRLEK